MHPLLQGIEFDKLSLARLGFFMGIEELQLTYAACIFRTLRPDIFLDVGANIGAYSLVLKNVAPKTQIVAIEASNATFAVLKENINNNQAKFVASCEIEALNFAATKTAGPVAFADFGNASGKSGVVSSSIHATNSAELVSVEGRPIDDLVGVQDKLIYLKFDTEGHEHDAIAGASKLLSRNNCIVQAELGHSQDSGQDVKSMLSDMGYRELFLIGPDQFFIRDNLHFGKDAALALHEQAILTFGIQRWGSKCPWLYG